MDCALKISSINSISSHSRKFYSRKNSRFLLSNSSPPPRTAPSSLISAGDANSQRSSLEALFCNDTAIPEEIIEKPIGLSLAEKNIGDKTRCLDCQAKGAVLCATSSGSGLYEDSILEGQGIIVKVHCLGCGGTGNMMCSDCGGRGHVRFA